MRLLAAEPSSIAGFLLSSEYLCAWNELCDPVFDGVGLKGFKNRANAFLLALIVAHSLFVSSCFPFLFFRSMGWYCGTGVFGLIGC